MIAPAGAETAGVSRGPDVRRRHGARGGAGVPLSGRVFHAKTVCVDSDTCSIGSANMDIRSFSINYETNLVST